MKKMMMIMMMTAAVARRRKREKEENTIRQALCKQSSRNGYYLLWFLHEIPPQSPRYWGLDHEEEAPFVDGLLH